MGVSGIQSNYTETHMGISGIRSKQLPAPYDDSRARWVKNIYGRHMDLVGQYKKNVCQMFADSIS